MFHRTKNLFLLSILTVSLAACSNGSQTGGDASTSANSSPAATAVSASEQKANPPATTKVIPGVKDASEVQFKTVPNQSQIGFFDTVNDSPELKHNVAKTESIKMSGWAALPGQPKVADRVIITLADSKDVVAVVPVNLGRSDVAKNLKNPAYEKSGWNATVSASALPAGKSVLKAWAYDSATKQATQLGRTHEITVE